MPELIYLAAPYSDKDPKVEEARYNLVTRVAAALIVKSGCEVFSPITHSHHMNIMAQRYAMEEGESWCPTYDFWLQFDYHMLDIADWLYVLMLKGWDTSKGILEEKKRFRLCQPDHCIKHISPEEYF
jgi:hypothetical protein